jgi:hypothetical protein
MVEPSALGTLECAARLTCFYRAGEPSGVASAWVVQCLLPDDTRKRLGELFAGADDGLTVDPHRQLQAGGPVFHGVDHGSAPPPDELVAGRDVMYVGVVPSGEALARVASLARSTTTVGHHRNMLRALSDLDVSVSIHVTLTTGESSVTVLWDWATRAWNRKQRDIPWPMKGAPCPEVVKHLSHNDMYRFDLLPNSRAVNKALRARGVNFATLSALAARGRIDERLVELGESHLRYEAPILARLAAGARPALVRTRCGKEYRVLVVNAPRLQTELGDVGELAPLLMETAPPDTSFAMAWDYDHAQDVINVRAWSNGGVGLDYIIPEIVGAEVKLVAATCANPGNSVAAHFTVAGDRIGAIAAPL